MEECRMMNELTHPEVTTYWIAYSIDKQIVHYGITDPEQVTTSGMDNFEYDITKEVLIQRLLDLGYKFVDPETEAELLPTIEPVGITKFDPLKPLFGEDRIIFEEVPVDIFSLNAKTILVEYTLVEKIGTGIKNGVTAVWDGVVYVWDSIIGWFKF
jgi:hypothetical protein